MKSSLRWVGWLAYVVMLAVCVTMAQERWYGAAIRVSPPSVAVPPIATADDSASVWLSDADDVIASSDPFRVARVPAAVAFRPDAEGTAGVVARSMPAAPTVRPTLTLKAIVGGPPWQAIVDGIPGQTSGTVVRAGAVFDHLVVRDVTRDSVVVEGPDTSWVLAFRRRP